MRQLVRFALLLSLLFAAAAPVFAQGASDFYLSLLRRGVADVEAGRYAPAISSLKIAAFGLVETVEPYESALVHLAIAQDRTGNPEGARDAMRRLAAAERVERKLATLQLSATTRAAFEELRRKHGAIVDAPAAGTATTTSRPTTSRPAATTTAPPSQAAATASEPAAAAPPRTAAPQPAAVSQTPSSTASTSPSTTPPASTNRATPASTTKAPETKPPATKTAAAAPRTPAPTPAPTTAEAKSSTPAPPPAEAKSSTPAPTPRKPEAAPATPAPAKTATTAAPATPAPAKTAALAPRDVAARFAAADRALEGAQLIEARRIYRELLDSGSLDRETTLRVAEGFYRSRDFAGALAAFKALGALKKGEEPYGYYLAVSLYETGAYEAAKKELTAALPYIESTPDVARYRAKIDGAVR